MLPHAPPELLAADDEWRWLGGRLGRGLSGDTLLQHVNEDFPDQITRGSSQILIVSKIPVVPPNR